MKTPSKWILCCASACVLTGLAYGQGEYGRPTMSGSSKRDQVGSQQPAIMQSADQSQQFFHAKDLVGQEARDAKGNRLGKIDDVVFNPQKGETFAAIGLSRDRYALVPWQALTVTSTGKRGKEQITLNTTKRRLESGPTLTAKQWENLNDPSFTQRLYSHYNMQPPTAMGGTGEGTTSGSSSGSGKRDSSRPLPGEPKY